MLIRDVMASQMQKDQESSRSGFIYPSRIYALLAGSALVYNIKPPLLYAVLYRHP